MVSPAEREALATRAAVLIRADLARFQVTGTGRVACLQGLLSCDVDKVGDDSHTFGALLTSKGMIVAPLWVTRTADAVLLEAPASAAAAIDAVLERSLPPRLCRHAVTTAETASVGVYGPAAAAALAVAAGSAGSLAPGRVAHLGHAGAPILAARVVARGLDGFDCVVPAGTASGLVARLAKGGALPVTSASLEERRILAGFPQVGAEIDDKTLPQEARLDELGAVSFTKGCYLGQETVARVHFRGHANRYLAGVAMEQLPAGLPAALMAGERTAGRLTSACWWEAGGCYAGLAVLRRDVRPGDTVTAPDGLLARVRELPWEPPADGRTP
jgi:folate-binding protein YgfZ